MKEIEKLRRGAGVPLSQFVKYKTLDKTMILIIIITHIPKKNGYKHIKNNGVLKKCCQSLIRQHFLK